MAPKCFVLVPDIIVVQNYVIKEAAPSNQNSFLTLRVESLKI